MTDHEPTPADGDVRVWWSPQIPGPALIIPAPDAETARFLVAVLATYDQFQFEHKIKPDYCNAGGIEVFDEGEWIEIDDEVTNP